MGNKTLSKFSPGGLNKKRLEEYEKVKKKIKHYEETDGDFETEVFIYCKEEEEELMLANKIIKKLADNKRSCVLGSPEFEPDDTVSYAHYSKAVVYLIGNEFDCGEVCCDVLTAAKCRAQVCCKVSQEVLLKVSKGKFEKLSKETQDEPKEFPSQCFNERSPWFIIEGDISATVDKLVANVIKCLEQGATMHDGMPGLTSVLDSALLCVDQEMPLKWREIIMGELLKKEDSMDVVDYLADEGKKIITPRMLCEDLMGIFRKWEGFSRKIGMKCGWPEKICSFIKEIDDVIDYCYLTVLETLLSRQDQKLTKDSLVKTLMLTGHPHLAHSISQDPNYTPTMRYLCKKLRLVRYEYREYGLLLGLDLPNISFITEHMETSSDLAAPRFAVVIIQWLQRHGGEAPTKELLKGVLENKQEKTLAENLMRKYEDFTFPEYKQQS